MNLSQATPDDLDSITDVMISAYPVDPQWDYCFPRRREFPEDNWKHTRSMMADLLQRDHFVVNVVTDGEKGGIIARKVVSVAVWELLLEKDSRQYEDSPGNVVAGVTPAENT
ncbi:hypothetical protein N7466_009404 [Penicillium verhagenii]|uniref:uncharacterized protein n=1 Tax=Penicillium verhagenii TaxID=1562060 RepID=UPI0025458454|nr:uncharacterized protein N7466_009404 [Penicillium verhagenii]KAJ5921078.1 hypothetical protein N7466_009404 [Penicillium verhagenii]